MRPFAGEGCLARAKEQKQFHLRHWLGAWSPGRPRRRQGGHGKERPTRPARAAIQTQKRLVHNPEEAPEKGAPVPARTAPQPGRLLPDGPDAIVKPRAALPGVYSLQSRR